MHLAIKSWASVSAIGNDTYQILDSLKHCRRGLGKSTFSKHLSLTDSFELIVGEVPLSLEADTRSLAILDMAVEKALSGVGRDPGLTGIFVGTTGGFFTDAEVKLSHTRETDPLAFPGLGQRGQGAVAEYVAQKLNAKGPILTFAMACTSSSAAISAAGMHLLAGTCNRAVVVGFDMLSNLTLKGFQGLMLYDPNPCRPFDVSRKGLQLGEGAAVIVIEPGKADFELVGWSNHMDPGNLTASSTDGFAARTVMLAALKGEIDQVVAIKAHGTGTIDNDLGEGRGIKLLFGDKHPPFVSLKGLVGHTLGAAGALEMALWLSALKEGFIPGTAGFTQEDPQIGVSPLKDCISAKKGIYLHNAFGFGGSCVSLAVKYV